MTVQELNIANALLTTKEILIQMLALGFGETKYTFVLSNMLVENFNLTQEQSIVIIKKSLELC